MPPTPLSLFCILIFIHRFHQSVFPRGTRKILIVRRRGAVQLDLRQTPDSSYFVVYSFLRLDLFLGEVEVYPLGLVYGEMETNVQLNIKTNSLYSIQCAIKCNQDDACRVQSGNVYSVVQIIDR